MKRIKQALASRRGESYMDTVITVLVVMFLLVLSLNVFTLLSVKQDLDYFAKELANTASYEGRTNEKVTQRYDALCEETGLKPDVAWEADYLSAPRQTVQLGDPITVKLTLHTDFKGFGVGSFPLTLRAKHSALSSRQWKEGLE